MLDAGAGTQEEVRCSSQDRQAQASGRGLASESPDAGHADSLSVYCRFRLEMNHWTRNPGNETPSNIWFGNLDGTYTNLGF